MSRRPKCPVTAPTTLSTAAPSVTSQAKAAALIRYVAVSSRATLSAWSRLRAYTTAMCTPSFASARQMRCPSPPLPPVTNATAPLRSIRSLRYAGAQPPYSVSPRPRTVCDRAREQARPSSGRKEGRLLRLGQPAGAHQATGAGAGVFLLFEDRRAGDEGGAVAMGPLHEPPPAGRQIGYHLRLMQSQPREVDQIEVGAQPRLEAAAIGEAEELGRLAGLHFDELRQRQAGTAMAIAAPMGQHERRHAGVDDRAAMRAAVAEAQQCPRIGQHLAHRPVIAVGVVDDREEQKSVEPFDQVIIGDFLRARILARGNGGDALVRRRLIIGSGAGHHIHAIPAPDHVLPRLRQPGELAL